MRITTKIAGVIASLAAVALLATGCSGTTGSGASGSTDAANEYDDVIKVNFGYIPDFNGTSLLAIAKDQGYWEKYGLDVTTTSFTNGPLQIQAIGTGDLDFGYIGPGAMWLPASGQVKVVAINTLGRADRVVAQAGINSIEDLKGKSVAYPEGTSGDMILTLALEKAGMTKDDIQAVPMDASAIVAALSSRQVDGAGFWYPALATVKQQVPDLVELAKNEDFEDTMAFPTAFVAGNDVVSKDPDKVERVLKALRDAIQFRAEHADEAIQLTAAFNALDPAAVAADADNVKILSLDELDSMTKDGTIDKWLTTMSDYFVGAGKLDGPVDGSEYYTGDLFLKAGE